MGQINSGNSRYSVNRDAIIFLDSDAEDGYKTIAYDEKNDKLLEISPPLYHILKAIDSAGSVTEEELEKLIKTFSSNSTLVRTALNSLLERGIIVKYEHSL
jgi:hypothetical protein